MIKKVKKYIVTAALPYANGPIHIGHLSGVYLPADIFVRLLRRKGKNVIFICGSDEHGVPVTIKAKKENVEPKNIVNKYHFMIKKTFMEFGISFNNYSRTTSEIHHKTTINFFKKLYYTTKIFSKKTTQQYYDTYIQQFLADRYIHGICPSCKYNFAYGDQCEKCGITLSPEELIDPKSTLSKSAPILKNTIHWYINLDQYENFLKKWILKKKKIWKINVYNQVLSWLNHGIKPRAITRDLNWGIPVPLEEAKGKVLYVWFEAPIGYISSTIELCKKNNIDWKEIWKNDDTCLINFIGKDNIVFHCIIFPVMLKCHGEYILPYNVVANEFLNLENKKISTSNNWAVWLHEFLEDFPKQQDTLRYILTINMPENKDNNFSWKDFQNRSNAELVGVLGNFINRSLILLNKYFDGIIPNKYYLSNKDICILKNVSKYPKIIELYIQKYNFRSAIIEVINLARLGNKYLTEESPWQIISYKPERVKSILYVSLQIVGMISQVCEPFMPNISSKLCKILNIPLYSWNKLDKLEILPTGKKIIEYSLLFKKIENYEIEKQLKKLKQN